MRLLQFIFLFALIGCAGTNNTTMESININGTWMPIRQELAGKELPKAVFETQKLIVSDNSYTVIAESIDKGTLKFSGEKIDIYGTEGPNNGKHLTAIYKLESGKLTICYNLKGDSYPVSFETKDNAMFFLSVFEKGK